MAKEMKIKAQKREVSGSGSVQRLRKQGLLPGVINNDKGESRLIQMNRHEFDMFIRHHTSESLILDVELEGDKTRKLLLKEVQHHPVSDEVLHVDFLEISMTKKMRVNIPIRLVGDPVGVISEGGVLDQLIRAVEVECLPTDLVEGIEVDVSGLKVGDAILVNQIKVDPKLVILTNGSVAVALVSIPKVIEETPAEAEATPTEPEVIGAKKEGEEGEGEEGAGEEGAEKGAEKGKEKGDKAGKDAGKEKAPTADKKTPATDKKAPAADKKAPAKEKKGKE
ncbi:MAG: 50S ribosomal protein L25 [Kiritimatiellae bacterium]|nr:50S ribosomal protein L25 [Kiritimatiellia bacterium]MDD5522134.1 50S ribosomal protein L25 [Kiritimatiellia bacterium]